MLAKAGFSAPPTSWSEVTTQAKAIKSKGLSDSPVMIGMQQESWFIEFMTALVYAHGGRFVDDDGQAVMQDPKAGALSALTWLVDAVQTHKIMSPGAVQTGELDVAEIRQRGPERLRVVAEIPPGRPSTTRRRAKSPGNSSKR